MPKPTSFVRKPFIPPPPSKESYYAPPKPTPPSKPAPQIPTTENREAVEDSNRDIEELGLAEPEISKESLKEKILAIQKGLDYTTRPPPHPPRRAETHEIDDLLKSPLTEYSTDPIAAGSLETHSALFLKETPEKLEEGQEVLEDASPKITADEEPIDDSSKTEENDEPDAPELDPEVARRIAIRERMAKMSGGMGMHMGLGLGPPAVFSKSKPAPKPHSSPPSSPPSERRDPIPIIPGFPPMGTREPETASYNIAHDDIAADVSELRSSSDKASDASQINRPMPEPPKAFHLMAGSSVSDVESEELEESSEEEERIHGRQDRVETYQYDSSDENSDEDESLASPKPIIPGDQKRATGSMTPTLDSPAGPSPLVPGSNSHSIETPARRGRPHLPPPPPPIPSVSHTNPPPVPVPFKHQPLLAPSSSVVEPKYDNMDEDDLSVDLDEQDIRGDPYDSPKSPVSRPPLPPPPPPPPPPSLLQKSAPTSFSKAPPIPVSAKL